jgi:hypothetical protein
VVLRSIVKVGGTYSNHWAFFKGLKPVVKDTLATHEVSFRKDFLAKFFIPILTSPILMSTKYTQRVQTMKCLPPSPSLSDHYYLEIIAISYLQS